MRIIYFFHASDGLGSDQFRHIADLANILAEKGHEFGLVCGVDDATNANHPSLDQVKKNFSLGVFTVPISANPSLATVTQDLKGARQAIAVANELRPYLLHGHGISGGALASYVTQALRHRKIKTACVQSPSGVQSYGLQARWPLSIVEKRLRRYVDGIIFEGHQDQANYQQCYGVPSAPTAIIHPGLKEEEFAPRQLIDLAADFLFVGPLTRASGVDILIQALARMKKDRPAGALIIGKGPQENELRRQVERYGLAHKVFFNAPLPTKMAFLKGECLVLPSRNPVSFYPLLQATAAGVPLILSDAGAVPEIIGDLDIPLVPSQNIEALQKQMTDYLDNPAPFLARSSTLRSQIAQHFTLPRLAEEVEQSYEQLLGETAK